MQSNLDGRNRIVNSPASAQRDQGDLPNSTEHMFYRDMGSTQSNYLKPGSSLGAV